ncbi:MAG: NmrA family NAD(P)-binding protein [Candidatus Nitrosocosmicus sp.]
MTGATGNIGSQLIKKLSNENVNIRAAVHSLSRSDKIQSLGVRDLVEIDFDMPSKIQYSIFKDVDKLFLLTPNFDTKGILKILEEAKKAGVQHIIQLSSDSVSLASAESKGTKIFKEKEKMIQESGIPYTILRPTAFMQNFLNNGFTIKTQNKFYLPWGKGKVRSVDTRDIASVAAKILISDSENYKNKSYSITGPEALSCYDIAKIFSEILENNIEFVDVSEEESFNEMRRMSMSDILIEYILELSRIIKQDSVSNISSSVEEITGKKPITFRKFVEDYKEAFKSNIAI